MRLSEVAARRREELELVAEVELVPEAEVDEVEGRVMQERAMSRKSKSLRMVLSPRTCIFRSPLSMMVLSPRIGIFRSPLSSQGPSSSPAINTSREGLLEIDLNAYPEEQMDNDQHVHEVEGAQGNTRPKRKEVPNSIRKAVIDALLARATNSCLKGHETREVSEEFSIHIRTVQQIWDQGKKCLG